MATEDGYEFYLIGGLQVKARLTMGKAFYLVVGPNGEEYTVLRQTFEKIAVKDEKKKLTYAEWRVLLDELNDEGQRLDRTIERMRALYTEKREKLLARKPEEMKETK
jgi:hypothetical protein